METGTPDPLNGERGVANAAEQLAIPQKAYQLLGAPKRLTYDLFEGAHTWQGERAIPWLVQWLVR